jgi:hypothetical protein
MKSRSAFLSFAVLLFIALSFATRLLADDIPTFNDPDVSSFAKKYAQFVVDYEDAYKAMKAGDNSKVQALQSKAAELQAEAGNVSEKVKPEEAQRFTEFIERCSQKLVDITKP